MFGRSKKPAQTLAPVADRPGAKNRPTPKRSTVEAARKRPLVPSDRKAATKSARSEARLARMKVREAMVTGDEKHLPPRDKGPVKRYVRDIVDARWNAGEFFLIIAMVVVALTLSRNPSIQLLSTALLWAVVAGSLFDGYLLSRILKKRLRAKFGEEGLAGGAVRYGVLRAFQIRRTRLPKPMVRRGQYPS